MLLSSLLLLLLANAVCLRRDKSILYNRVAFMILLYSSIIGYDSWDIVNSDRGLSIYGGLFQCTSITQSLEIFIYLLGGIILQLTGSYAPAKQPHSTRYGEKSYIAALGLEPNSQIEYPLIILFILLGSTLLISSSDLVSMFLAIELQSYGIYILSTIYRNSELSTSAGLTYFLLGGLSSCLILLGSSILYINTGITNLDGIYILSNYFETKDIENIFTNLLSNNKTGEYLNIALIILSIGYLFKVASAPFHFWSPDVYDALPTIVTTFVAIIPKISILIFLLNLSHESTVLLASNFYWVDILLISLCLSLIIGTVGGLVQIRIKRLLAYSAISHVGFVLLGLVINKIGSLQAFMFYLIQYSLSNANIFFIILVIGYYLKESVKLLYKESEHSPLQFTNQLKGYYNINPLMSLSLAISIFSLAGIPPLIGFFAKQSVLLSALLNGYYFLSIVAVLTSVIGGVYYLGLIKYIYFDEEENLLNEKNIKIYIPSSWAGIISIITLGILLFIIDPIILLSNANILGLGLGFNLGVDGICIPSNLSYLVPLIFNKSKLTIRKPILIWLCTVTVGSIVKILNVLGINGLTLTLKGKAPLGNIDLSKLSIANENKKKNMNIYSYIFKYYLIRFNYWGVPLELINRNTLASSVGTMVINIIFIPILSFILLGLNLLLGPHNPYQEKSSTFECGFSSFLGQNRSQFSISFFIFALLFLLFDLEILLVYPYVVSGYNNEIYGWIIVIILLIILSVGFVFEMGRSALKIYSRQISNLKNLRKEYLNNLTEIREVIFK